MFTRLLQFFLRLILRVSVLYWIVWSLIAVSVGFIHGILQFSIMASCGYIMAANIFFFCAFVAFAYGDQWQNPHMCEENEKITEYGANKAGGGI